jgi:MOSC domain-containing protein YiiM
MGGRYYRTGRLIRGPALGDTRAMADGALLAIWLKRVKGGPMAPVDEADLEAGLGLAGNADRGGRRQVTILDADVWAAVAAALGVPLPPGTRRANLLVRGLALPRSVGRILALGPARLRVLGETKPCEVMEAALPGLEAALRPDWRGGIYGEVVEGGRIRVGDPVRWA